LLASQSCPLIYYLLPSNHQSLKITRKDSQTDLDEGEMLIMSQLLNALQLVSLIECSIFY
jgi:hypothetical protein